MHCSLIRDGITSTSVYIDVMDINPLRRWIVSSIRLSGNDVSKYHFIGCSDLGDISSSDVLEEMTGGITGASFDIVNKRELTGSHLEFDLEIHGSSKS